MASPYTVALVVVVTYLIYRWVKKTLTYWRDRGVKGPTPIPFVGSMGKVVAQKKSIGELLNDIYYQYPNERAVGVYLGLKPTLLIRDPEILKEIFVKDFNNFQDRGVKKDVHDKFNDNLFVAEGNTWKILRHKLTPIFTSNKLRTMIPLVDKCVEQFESYVDKLVDQGKDHEIRSLASKYTLEVIGSCAFGIDMDTFTDSPNPFWEMANFLFVASTSRSIGRFLESFVPVIGPIIVKYAKLEDSAEVKNFFLDFVDKVVKEREGKKKMRNDFMDLMIELREQGTIERKEADKTIELELCTELMAAQALVFFAAGFETSSATMSFMMFELALNQDIQQRLYEEVVAVTARHEGKITYDSIKEMQYLEMCFDETLRKYPVAATLVRKTSEKYKIPDTDYVLEKGVGIMVSILALHNDPKYFKNPEVFDPERFSPKNKPTINRYVYMPFGEGPRNCIGMRFAKVQSMIGIASFIRKFRLEKSEKTPSFLEYNPQAVTLTSKDGIWLNITRR